MRYSAPNRQVVSRTASKVSRIEQSEICVLFMNTTKIVIFGQNVRICFLYGAVARDDRTPRRWKLACVA